MYLLRDSWKNRTDGRKKLDYAHAMTFIPKSGKTSMSWGEWGKYGKRANSVSHAIPRALRARLLNVRKGMEIVSE